MDVRLPDGTIIQGVPDGTTKADLVAKLKSNGVAVPAEWLAAAPTPQASQSVGSALREIPRQVGLTARYGIEGLGQVADVVTEPIRQLAVNPLARLIGAPEAKSTSGAASSLADSLGLPSPQTADERVIGDASRLVAGAGGMAGAAGAAARALPRAAGKAAATMAANPGQQAIGAASAGAAGGSVRESGGDPWEQFLASLSAGVATPMAANTLAGAAKSAGNAIKRALTPQTVIDQQVDQQITLALNRSGVDWATVPERIKQSLRTEVQSALNTGQPLNADAMRRLVVMKRAGVEPTVGQITQDPGQITREANLAKTGANSVDVNLQRLPALQNTNTRALLTGLDNAGAANAPTASQASQSAIGSMRSNLTSAEASRDALYQAARDSQGRSVVLDGPAAAQVAARRLQQDLAGKLPPEIDKVLNDLTTGATPLTVDYQQQLVRALGDRIRGAGADGTLRHGLGIVRSALDNADVLPTPKVNPGNLPAVAGTVPQSTQQAGQEAIAAFQRARGAHRALMQRIEGNPALQAVADGVEPDQFMQRYVIGSGATAADVRALRGELSPQAAQQMRQALVKHLKDKATGGDEDITKFAGKTYRDELRRLSDKLPAFFSREEIQQLDDIGNAAKYMQAQPAGAAVNNSNSGALMLGRTMDTLDRIAGYVPLGGKDVIRGVISGVQQRQVMTPANALRTLAPPQQRANPLLMLPLLAGQAQDR